MADLDLTVDELRAVTAYALEPAADLLGVFEALHPDDLRPREAAAYLHPIARATQVGHVLRAAALAARVAELEAGDPAAAEERLTRSAAGAEPVVVEVLRRYPPAPDGRSRVAELVRDLEGRLRARRDAPA